MFETERNSSKRYAKFSKEKISSLKRRETSKDKKHISSGTKRGKLEKNESISSGKKRGKYQERPRSKLNTKSKGMGNLVRYNRRPRNQRRKLTGFDIPQRTFSRIVRQILNQMGFEEKKWRYDALQALHYSAELYMYNVFSAGHLAALHAKRKTVTKEDIEISMKLSNILKGCTPFL